MESLHRASVLWTALAVAAIPLTAVAAEPRNAPTPKPPVRKPLPGTPMDETFERYLKWLRLMEQQKAVVAMTFDTADLGSQTLPYDYTKLNLQSVEILVELIAVSRKGLQVPDDCRDLDQSYLKSLEGYSTAGKYIRIGISRGEALSWPSEFLRQILEPAAPYLEQANGELSKAHKSRGQKQGFILKRKPQ